MTTDPAEVRRRAGTFLILSLAVAAGTAWVGYSLVSRHEARLEAEFVRDELAQVVVAREPLAAGVPIERDAVELVQLPVSSVQPEVTFSSLDDVVGQTPRHQILLGEAIRSERLQVGPGGLKAHVAIPEGARAMAVRVEVASGVAGLLEPGFCVDVIVTVRPEERAIAADWVTETILQDVRIVATEDAQVQLEGGRASPRRDILVTLEVDPEEAERLAMASSLGKLHLALRHAADHSLREHQGPLVTNAMVGLAVTSPSAQKRRKSWSSRHRKKETSVSAEVIQGSQVEVERFDAAGKKVDGGSRGRRR